MFPKFRNDLIYPDHDKLTRKLERKHAFQVVDAFTVVSVLVGVGLANFVKNSALRWTIITGNTIFSVFEAQSWKDRYLNEHKPLDGDGRSPD